MKRAYLLIATICFPIILHAQSALDRLFDKYSGKAGYTTVSINQSMFDLFSAVADGKEDKEFKDISSRLSSIRILSCECKTGANAVQEFYKQVIRLLPASEYQNLMEINDGGETVKLLIKKHGEKISELVMVAGGKDASVISLTGDIDLKQVSRLSKSMNIKGLDHLDKVSDNGKKAK